jgi:hypothetical protein
MKQEENYSFALITSVSHKNTHKRSSNTVPYTPSSLRSSLSVLHTYPFLAPCPAKTPISPDPSPFKSFGLPTWKKNLTIKTCRPAIHTIIRLSITLKLKILLSVLLTVLKLRFSRVRKYFWLRVTVESCPESLKIDSSSADVCSGDVPCLEGIWASRCSFSTLPSQHLVSILHLYKADMKGGKGEEEGTYSDLEIHKFLRKSTHLVIETELIFARLRSCEHEVSLSLLLSIHYDFVLWSDDLVVDVERSSCLDLFPAISTFPFFQPNPIHLNQTST